MSKYILFAIFVLLGVLAFSMLAYLLKAFPKKAKSTVAEDNEAIDDKLFETINLSINDINNENSTPVNNDEPLYNKDDIVYTEDTKEPEQKIDDDKTIEIEINSANL